VGRVRIRVDLDVVRVVVEVAPGHPRSCSCRLAIVWGPQPMMLYSRKASATRRRTWEPVEEVEWVESL